MCICMQLFYPVPLVSVTFKILSSLIVSFSNSQIAQVPPKNLFRWLAMRKRDYAEGQQPCIATEDHTGYNVLEEHWDSLIPIERFRRACSENILDLHSLSEREILESLCGTGEEGG